MFWLSTYTLDVAVAQGTVPNAATMNRELSCPARFEHDQRFAAWYHPRLMTISPPDVAKQAYEQALRFHHDEFASSTGTTSWLSSTSSVHDILHLLAETQKKYVDKRKGRWKTTTAAVSWWKLLSARMMQYEKVIDTFVASHPEYSALVWGAMRFLFTVTINHEELSSKIAQSFAEIGEVLPEAEFISQSLYPTQRIRYTLASVYAQIVEFCIRATKWYDRLRQSPVKKVLGAVFKTWPLEFQDIKVKIDVQLRRLREQSAVAHQAETREMHIQISEIQCFLNQVSPVSRAFGKRPMLSVVNKRC